MSHFAEIDENGIVVRVIVAGQDFIDSGAVGDPSRWVRTSYNGNIRVRFAGVGDSYDAERDAFIPLRPFPSWALDDGTIGWAPPLPRPPEGNWEWNERLQQWQKDQKGSR